MLDRFLGGYVTASPTLPTQSSAQGVWELEQQASAQVQNAWPLPPNVIQRSLRFNAPDSAYLSRTPATASNRKTWTWSGWVKRSSFSRSTELMLFACRPAAGTYTLFSFRNTGAANPDTLFFEDNNGASIRTTPVYRDPSGWYHIVLAVDTTQATTSNRIRFYVNGTEVTSFGASTYPSQNLDMQINTANSTGIGGYSYNTSEVFDGYMAEINFIDGQALTPSSFGETDAQTGVWVPKRYTGTYGTNGFRLPFTNNSTTTALGFDASGNGNNWTPNNFSVTAGSGNDSLLDVPSLYGTDTGLGGEVRGNYATWNPLVTGATLANGNLDCSTASGTWGDASGSIGMKSGKWYFEATCTSVTSNQAVVGVTKISFNGTGESDTFRISYQANGTVSRDGITTNTTGLATWGVGDVVGAALDVDNGTMSFYKNGVLINTTTNALIQTTEWRFFTRQNGSGFSANFGQRPFAYTAPTGFKALCTTNLSAPAIGQTSTNQADNYFAAVTYTGNGNSSPGQLVPLSFQPDLVWVKERNSTEWHQWYDALRTTNALFSNSTDAEVSLDGVTLQSNGFYAKDVFRTNQSTEAYISWSWYAGGSTVSNTQGTITSSVRANPSSGFSVVTYTGNGSAFPTGATVGHGLGAIPQFIILKRRNDAGNWNCYHVSIGNANRIDLNTTSAVVGDAGAWNSTTPTSTLFSIGNSGNTNTNTTTYVAYCFAAIPGFSAFGSYTGNASTDGPFVYLGFRPAFVMIKSTSATTEWVVMDTSRSLYNVSEAALYANRDYSETTVGAVNDIDFLSNGFKLRNSTGFVNSSQTYIYAAFAEYPFRLSLAR